MIEYHLIAREYFRRLEGWHLYREQGDALLCVWAALGIGWVVSIGFLFRTFGSGSTWSVEFWLVLVGELLLLVLGSYILSRKSKALIQSVNSEFGVDLKTDRQCRQLLLHVVLQQPASRFLASAKEISDLLGMQRQFRGSNEMGADFYWRKIYDRESKPRLLAVTLAAISVATALTLRFAPDVPIFEVLDSLGFRQLMASLLLISGIGFGMLVGVQMMFRELWNTAALWMAKTVLSRESDTALRYLARDLVLFHKPERDSSFVPLPGEGT